MTRGIDRTMAADPLFPLAVNECMARHLSGDRGDVDDESRGMNDASLREEKGKGGTIEELLSMHSPGGTGISIITGCDRSATTVLSPEDCRFTNWGREPHSHENIRGAVAIGGCPHHDLLRRSVTICIVSG